MFLLPVVTGCPPDKVTESGEVSLTFADPPWAAEANVTLTFVSADDETEVRCSSRPDNSEGGEFNLSASGEVAEGDPHSASVHLRQMGYTGDGEYGFFHGSDFGFLQLDVNPSSGLAWHVPYFDPLENRCEGTLSDNGSTGSWQCLDLPLNSDGWVEPEDNSPEARADLFIEWTCG